MERKYNMKKQFFIPACVLTFAALAFVLYALGHPELSFPWNAQMTHILYGVYVDRVVLLFVLAFWKKTDRIYVMAIICELGAVFFLVQSMLSVFPKGESNWYLPLALGLNYVALFLNAVQKKRSVNHGEKE